MWVGIETGNCDSAFELLAKLSHVGELLLNLPAMYVTDEFRSHFQQDSFWYLWELFNREYWHRLWILQEVALATNICLCCGRHSIGWDIIHLARIFMTECTRVGFWPGPRSGGNGGFRLLTRIGDSVPAQLDKERAYQKTKSLMPRRESDR